jgi:hypothetical protein
MTTESIKHLLAEPLFDMGIVHQGFTAYMRDYDLIAEINNRQFLYRFTHCVSAIFVTMIKEQDWRASWDDIFTDYSVWKDAGTPKGFVWGAAYARAYPGAELLEGSPSAEQWSARLGRQMYHARNRDQRICARVDLSRFAGQGTRKNR